MHAILASIAGHAIYRGHEKPVATRHAPGLQGSWNWNGTFSRVYRTRGMNLQGTWNGENEMDGTVKQIVGRLKRDGAFMERVSIPGRRRFRGFITLIMENPTGYMDDGVMRALFASLFPGDAGCIEQDVDDERAVKDWNGFLAGMDWSARSTFDDVLGSLKEYFGLLDAAERDAMLDLLFMYGEIDRVFRAGNASFGARIDDMRYMYLLVRKEFEPGYDVQAASIAMDRVYEKTTGFQIYIEPWMAW
jgi:hypothetical protein